jgi:DNA-binding transcriptional LysR family regulator
VRTQRILGAARQALVEVCEVPEQSATNIGSSITRTQMRCLLAISNAKSFSEAAQSIDISEASLQRAARQLERNMGCQLYKNAATGVTTTPVGAEFSKRMALVASQIEAAREDIVHYNHPKERSITIGVLLLDPTILLTTAIRDMGEGFEDVRIAFVSGGYEVLLNKLNSGQVDFMIGLLKRPDYAESIREEPLYRDRYCVVVRRGHPLIGARPVSVDDLRRYGWMLPQRGSPRRLAFEQIFSDGKPPAASIESYSLSTIRVMLLESDMLTVLSLTEMLSEQRIGLLAPVDFDVPGEGSMVGITTRRDWQPNDVQSAFLAAIKRASGELRHQHGFETAGLEARS